MQKDFFDRVLGFLLGVSWAILLIGAILIFQTFLLIGFYFSLFVTSFFLFIMFFIILALDAFAINREKLKELKKHTKLLEELKNIS